MVLLKKNEVIPKARIILKWLENSLLKETNLEYRKIMDIWEKMYEKAKLATWHQLTYLLNIYTALFQKMMDRGQMVKGDAEIIALEFVSPITVMVQLLDREPRKKKEAFQTIEKHIDVFLERYGFI